MTLLPRSAWASQLRIACDDGSNSGAYGGRVFGMVGHLAEKHYWCPRNRGNHNHSAGQAAGYAANESRWAP